MKEYKYHLDKTSKKFNCPQCGKKTFVKYVDTETGHYADSKYGRCDREIKCGYLEYPNGNSIINYHYVTPPPIKPSYIDKEILQKTLTKYETNPLIIYLYNNYDKDQVNITIEKYKIGTSKQFNSSTIFWQIDHTGKIRSGKIMGYDIKTGKRQKNKDGKALIHWAHSVLEIPKFTLKQCLFGLHLCNNNVKKVAIVESEKTAVILSIEFPNHTWISTSSINGFKIEYLKPLKNTEIIAFPDNGGYDKWKTTANNLNRKGFNIIVSELIEIDEYEIGWDLVDVLNYYNEKKFKCKDKG
jgi:hypothetical protein